VNVTVNGRLIPLGGGARQRTLQELIRDAAALRGTAGACGHGVCGACTVIVDGRPARSCLMLAAGATGRTVTTVEGLESAFPEVTRLLRNAFLERNAFQCGYCTAGMLVLAAWWLTTPPEQRPACPDPTALLASNLCRCTGYDGLRSAIHDVDESLGGSR
jgi:carbon-monoxide dehydrogenase small subunit